MSTPSITFTRRRYPMAAVNMTFGDIVCIDTSGGGNSGYAIVATSGDGITKRPKGIACAFYDASDNKLGPATSTVAGQNSGGSLGSMYVEVEWSLDKNGGIKSFRCVNDTGGGALTQANVGQNVYVKDHVTVTSTSTSNSHAGELDRVNSDGTVNVIFPISY
jgi:hypothetical protein